MPRVSNLETEMYAKSTATMALQTFRLQLTERETIAILTAEDIARITIWNEQRPILPDKLDDLIAAKEEELKKGPALSFPELTICELEREWILIDGQHRFHAWQALRPAYAERLPPLRAAIIRIESEHQLRELFEERNKGITPLTDLDYQKRTQSIVQSAIEEWVKADDRLKLGRARPAIDVENMARQLFREENKELWQTKLSATHALWALQDYVEENFEKLHTKYRRSLAVKDTTITKARSMGYVGLFVMPNSKIRDAMLHTILQKAIEHKKATAVEPVPSTAPTVSAGEPDAKADEQQTQDLHE